MRLNAPRLGPPEQFHDLGFGILRTSGGRLDIDRDLRLGRTTLTRDQPRFGDQIRRPPLQRRQHLLRKAAQRRTRDRCALLLMHLADADDCGSHQKDLAQRIGERIVEFVNRRQGDLGHRVHSGSGRGNPSRLIPRAG